jgi:acyl-CoA synthetase (AMP-forming)/AMP-acid ligase II
MPKQFSGDKQVPFKTVGQLIEAGEKLPKLEELKWEKGQGARQTAYLCYSSGTSGLPVCKLHNMQEIMWKMKQVLTDCLTERRHDQPPKCHCQHHANRDLRETNAGQGAAERENPYCSRSLTIKSHLWLGSYRPSQHVSRRRSDHSPKIRTSVLSTGNSNIQDPNLVFGPTDYHSNGQE